MHHGSPHALDYGQFEAPIGNCGPVGRFEALMGKA